MASLNVVALISGGKDSLFSILHCEANGHNVVALANLHPPNQAQGNTIEDLESYMYQTVGHAVISLYEQALGLPLYRQEITGTAINKDKTYSPAFANAVDDETESLFTLLCKMKREHPSIDAVSTGAILSDYQRTRVESVALRLGMVPLSYLWQWPSLPPHTQESLLVDMAAVGQDSRIIKVASGGLDNTFLWQNVADGQTITRLARASQRFGTAGDGAVLGEGGEYETLAVSGPSPLWKGRIEVPPQNVQTVSGDAGSASIRIIRPAFTSHRVNASASSDLRIPALLDARFAELRRSILTDELDGSNEPADDLPSLTSPNEHHEGGTVILNNVCGIGSTASDQARSIMDDVVSRLGAATHSIHDIAYSIIILRQMSDFGKINEVYGSYFPRPNPPARVTIACADALPKGALLSISITSALGPREGLHVQSRSYWAPANIGPYSQAIKFPGANPSAAVQSCVFIAGQIPLIPATMQLPDNELTSPADNFAKQATLSLQHLHRIGCVMRVTQWVFGIAFITPHPLHDVSSDRTQLVKHAWRGWHLPTSAEDTSPDDVENFDVWDHKYGPGSLSWRVQGGALEAESARSTDTPLPSLVVIQVDSLPRGADVEWVGFGTVVNGTYTHSVPLHLQGLLQSFQHQILLAE